MIEDIEGGDDNIQGINPEASAAQRWQGPFKFWYHSGLLNLFCGTQDCENISSSVVLAEVL